MGGNAVTSSEVKTHYETHNYSSAKTATEIFKQTSIASKLDPHYL